MDGQPIRSPVDGAEIRAQIRLPNGFEYEVAEVGSGSSRSIDPMRLEHSSIYGQFDNLHLDSHGIVRYSSLAVEGGPCTQSSDLPGFPPHSRCAGMGMVFQRRWTGTVALRIALHPAGPSGHEFLDDDEADRGFVEHRAFQHDTGDVVDHDDGNDAAFCRADGPALRSFCRARQPR